ncbi:hypothetical protein D9758_017426 [Tetrapyrgos nigripes]|uniref:HTH psq-type domain-containing protein n=1 Tax=Tetrapyrgos nigripes TaxID=182062 RepID=A0A8H5FE71_9AGAR|nr:hypothetical protein D9758_017426 [Tetrapyrgos nigripes]
MPAPQAQWKRKKKLDKQETKIQQALNDLASGIYKSCPQAAAAYGIPYQTLYKRRKGQTQDRRKAHSSQQNLNPTKESVLVDWAKFLASTGHPVSRRTISPKFHALTGQRPGLWYLTRN